MGVHPVIPCGCSSQGCSRRGEGTLLNPSPLTPGLDGPALQKISFWSSRWFSLSLWKRRELRLKALCLALPWGKLEKVLGVVLFSQPLSLLPQLSQEV